MQFSPLGENAYVTNYLDNSISIYHLEKDGKLNPLHATPVPTGKYPNKIIFDRAGKQAFVLNSGESSISIYDVNKNAGLALRSTKKLKLPKFSLQDAVLDHSGKSIYLLSSPAGQHRVSKIYRYKLSRRGLFNSAFKPIVLASGGANLLALELSGKYLYVLHSHNSKQTGTISAFHIFKNGALAPLNKLATSAPPYANGIAFHPSGKFVYVTNDYTNPAPFVSMYQLNSTNGQLTPLMPKGSLSNKVTTGAAPSKILIDHSGKYVYVINYFQGTASIFNVDPQTGELLPHNPSTVRIGGAATNFTFDPSGKYLYVTNGGNS